MCNQCNKDEKGDIHALLLCDKVKLIQVDFCNEGLVLAQKAKGTKKCEFVFNDKNTRSITLKEKVKKLLKDIKEMNKK